MIRLSRKFSGRSRQGFSLIELLVAIGIIVILVSLLFPFAKNQIEAANAAKCLGNLRQIGVAAHQWMAENNNRMIYTRPQDGSSVPSSDPSRQSWVWLLAPYVGYTGDFASTEPCPAVFRCPSSASMTVRQDRTYCYNSTSASPGSGLGNMWGGYDESGRPIGKSALAIAHPSTYVMVFDVLLNDNRKIPWKNNDSCQWQVSYETKFPPGDPDVSRPHYQNRAMNLLFYDGHAARHSLPLPDEFYYFNL